MTKTFEQDSKVVPIDELLGTTKEVHDLLVSSFKDVPLRIDLDLEGNSWYCAVSKELFEEIKRSQN